MFATRVGGRCVVVAFSLLHNIIIIAAAVIYAT